MKTINPIILLLLLTLNSCTNKKNSTDKPGTVAARNYPADSSTASIDTAAKPAIASKEFKGFYINGNEVNTFRDCQTGQTYWVEDKTGQLQIAYQKAKSNLSYPYESAYVSIKGYLKGKSTDGYASEYTNVLVVTDIIDLKQKSLITDCFDYEFIALGTEPFWGLEIIPSENIIALKDVSAEKAYVFPYKKPQTVSTKVNYDLTNGKNETLKVTFIRENCNDGMSDRSYDYSAIININGKTLSGCAVKKQDK